VTENKTHWLDLNRLELEVEDLLKSRCMAIGGEYDPNHMECVVKVDGEKTAVGIYNFDIDSEERNLHRLVDAAKEIQFSQGKWTNPYDTEYYSADGYDDYQCERRVAAREHAVKQIATALFEGDLIDAVIREVDMLVEKNGESITSP